MHRFIQQNPMDNRMDETQINEQIFQLENIVAAMPGTIYWKDTEGRLLGCNNNQARVFDLNKNDIFSKNILEIGSILNWEEKIAIEVHQNSLEVISKRHQKQIEEIVLVNGVWKHFLSCKNPLFDSHGNVVGLAGASIEVSKNCQTKIVETYLEKIEKIITFNSNKSFPKLAKREIECLYFMIRGMTAKQIGKLLNLSFRTIETYIENMKLKLNCCNRSELIGKAIDLGYIHISIGNQCSFEQALNPHDFLNK